MISRHCVSRVICCTSKIRQTLLFTKLPRQSSSLPIIDVELPSEPVIPEPYVSEDDRQYPEKIKNIVQEISKLTLLEVAELNDLLKKTLNIQNVPVMATGAVTAAAEDKDESDIQPQSKKTSFLVKLSKFDPDKKIQLIKEVRNMMEGLNLVQAKKFVESLPQIIRKDISKDEAESLKTTLESAGGVIEID